MNSATNTFNKTNHFVKSKTNSQLILNSQTNTTTETQIYFASLKMLMDKNDFNNFIDSLHIYLPNISQRYPDVLLAAYQCWLLLYKATDMTNDYEMIFSKYIIPLCLQCPEQMHQLKTKQLYSYLGNSNMIIKDNTRFKELVEQYINRVLLLVNSLIHKEVNTQQGIDAQTQIDIDSIVLNQIEGQMVQLFQINNPIQYFLNKKTYSNTTFESIVFNEKQEEDLYSPLFYIKEIPTENDLKPIEKSNKSNTLLNDPNSNYNLYSKQSTQKTIKAHSFKKNNEFLRHFKPKFLKKENIDKKILRRFRAYIKELSLKHPEYLQSFDSFWTDFSDIKLLPPMQYTESNQSIVEFKSFNTKYFNWLFSKSGAIELFNTFANQQGDHFLNEFIEEYKSKLIKEEGMIKQLREYFNLIPSIYSQSSMITSEDSESSMNRLDSIDELKQSNKFNAITTQSSQDNICFLFENTKCPCSDGSYENSFNEYEDNKEDFLYSNDHLLFFNKEEAM